MKGEDDVRILESTENLEQTEELLVSGASLVFYDVRQLKSKLTNEEIRWISASKDFKIEKVDVGYNFKIFSSDANDQNKHMIIRCTEFTELPMIHLGTESKQKSVIPKVCHYLVIYDRNTVVIQSVIVFDQNEVTRFSHCTDISAPLSTDDLLTILQDVKEAGRNGYKDMKVAVDRILERFSEAVKNINIFDEDAGYEAENESVGIQIWDINSLKIEKGAMIIGEDLEKRYELELSALMGYKNEHFSSNHLWKNQSVNSVTESGMLHTDVLNDHRILRNERVCVEISQVNYPELRHISGSRLCTYGYDSTSIFLWGYIQIIKNNYSRCQNKAALLRSRVSKLLENPGRTTEDARTITREKTQLYKELEVHNRIMHSCIEKRHQEFIEKGMKATGLDLIHKDMEEIFRQISEGISVAISTQTSSSGAETAEVLKAIQKMNKLQADASTRLALIAIIFAAPSILSICEFCVSMNQAWDNIRSKIIILIICVVCYVAFVVIYMCISRRKKRRERVKPQ